MEIVTQRSVINLGQGSYIITLPKVWCDYLGIRPGQRLEVIANEDLTIRVKKSGKTNSENK